MNELSMNLFSSRREGGGTSALLTRQATGGTRLSLVPVASSNLAAVAYDWWTETLAIEFRGGRRYGYARVPWAVYEALMRSPSKGQFFQRVIRDRFPCARLR